MFIKKERDGFLILISIAVTIYALWITPRFDDESSLILLNNIITNVWAVFPAIETNNHIVRYVILATGLISSLAHARDAFSFPGLKEDWFIADNYVTFLIVCIYGSRWIVWDYICYCARKYKGLVLETLAMIMSALILFILFYIHINSNREPLFKWGGLYVHNYVVFSFFYIVVAAFYMVYSIATVKYGEDCSWELVLAILLLCFGVFWYHHIHCLEHVYLMSSAYVFSRAYNSRMLHSAEKSKGPEQKKIQMYITKYVNNQTIKF